MFFIYLYLLCFTTVYKRFCSAKGMGHRKPKWNFGASDPAWCLVPTGANLCIVLSCHAEPMARIWKTEGQIGCAFSWPYGREWDKAKFKFRSYRERDSIIACFAALRVKFYASEPFLQITKAKFSVLFPWSDTNPCVPHRPPYRVCITPEATGGSEMKTEGYKPKLSIKN